MAKRAFNFGDQTAIEVVSRIRSALKKRDCDIPIDSVYPENWRLGSIMIKNESFDRRKVKSSVTANRVSYSIRMIARRVSSSILGRSMTN